MDELSIHLGHSSSQYGPAALDKCSLSGFCSSITALLTQLTELTELTELTQLRAHTADTAHTTDS